MRVESSQSQPFNHRGNQEVGNETQTMKFLHKSSKIAFLHMATRHSCEPLVAFSRNKLELSSVQGKVSFALPNIWKTYVDTRLYATAGQGNGGFMIRHVEKNEMEEIVKNYENEGRKHSGYVIIDVREAHEIESTGKISPNTLHLPMCLVAQSQIFRMDEDEFEEMCGFPKPSMDETLVFTCAAGIRSSYVCNFAAQSGYSKLINYRGGANEWFY